MFKYLVPKLIASIAIVPVVFVITEPQQIMIFGIIFSVIIDTILGVWVAIKYRRFYSPHLRRTVSKSAQYGFAMLSVWVLASVDPMFCWVFKYMGVFIILTEILSNFEKLALIGFKAPTALIAKLNENFAKLKNGNIKDAKDLIDERNKM